MIAVIVEWNTDENSAWIDEADRLPIPGEDQLEYPLSLVGPFENLDEAFLWMQDALPDNTDVLDMYSIEREFPKDWFIATPTEYPDGYYRPAGQSKDSIISVVYEVPMPIPRPV